MESLYSIIYASTPTNSFKEQELHKLLYQSRKKNELLHVTGMLIFYGKGFLQYIEGKEEDVKNLYHSICEDERHKDIVLLQSKNIVRRRYKDWPMLLKSLSKEEFLKLSKESEGLNLPKKIKNKYFTEDLAS